MTDNLHNLKNNSVKALAVSLLITSLLMLPIAGCSTGTGTANTVSQTPISAFDQKAIINTILNLASLEIDSYHAYNEISKVIRDKEFKEFCVAMRDNHEKHILEYSAILQTIHIQPPLFTKEFVAFTIPGFTLIQGAKNQYRALQALQTNEIIANKFYKDAVSLYMPASFKEIIWRNAEEEKLYLKEIERRLQMLK